jgi:hypothetical protein
MWLSSLRDPDLRLGVDQDRVRVGVVLGARVVLAHMCLPGPDQRRLAGLGHQDEPDIARLGAQ